MAVQQEIDYEIHYGDPEASEGISVFSREFDERFYYEGNDLGLTYSAERSLFRLWAPTAWEARVALYRTWNGEPVKELDMTRGAKGTWSAAAEEDLQGWFYTYKVRVGDQWNEAVDPYAKAVGINGNRGAIVDLLETNPSGWTMEKPPFQSPLDAVIYEVHVRDVSVHPQSGIKHKGKYLGLCEAGTRGPGGISTGLDHIAGMGVTHVQLLPVHDYSTLSVDETDPEARYNWGYDPQNYNVPEGSYATDPYDPFARIRELKQMVQTLHDRGLRVIMDVVYNHVYDGYRVNFTKLVPGYYLRYRKDGSFSNGAFCGNEVASERPMTRKFIVDSVLYWVKEYNIDGFRFDLMGLHDVGLMQEIRRRLDEHDPSVLMLGEGWNLDTVLPAELRATLFHAGQLPRIGQFNDRIRNAVKGNQFFAESRGFVGGEKVELEVKKGVAAAVYYDDTINSYALEPDQSINYVECHDNRTLWDRLQLVNTSETDEELTRMHRLASAIVLTSQGIPFLHAGQEFMRSKNGVEDSFNSPDEINRLDWERCAERPDDVEYMRNLIMLRRNHPAFRLRNADAIRAYLHFEAAPEHCVAFTLRDHAGGDPARHLYVVYHANRTVTEVELPALGKWQVILGSEHIERLEESRMLLKNIGMVVLAISE
jgi:pullulanase